MIIPPSSSTANINDAPLLSLLIFSILMLCIITCRYESRCNNQNRHKPHSHMHIAKEIHASFILSISRHLLPIFPASHFILSFFPFSLTNSHAPTTYIKFLSNRLVPILRSLRISYLYMYFKQEKTSAFQV